MNVEESYDIVVVGAGHAGCEASLAAARMGFETIMFTVSMDSVALMPCNPNIGGSSKGHLVREIDALGGEMGKNIDKTFIQSKMLNVSKGPAVHSLRAQADKGEYTKQMRMTLQAEPKLTLRQGEVAELLFEEVGDSENSETSVTDDTNKDRKRTVRITGVKTFSGAVYHAKAVILCTGVYLKAMCIYGDTITYTGPNGLMAANHLSQSMIDAGIPLRRFKTGTPPRLDGNTIDYSVMAEQKGDEHIQPFSFTNKEEDIMRDQISCWLTYTSEETHEIIRENIDGLAVFHKLPHLRRLEKVRSLLRLVHNCMVFVQFLFRGDGIQFRLCIFIFPVFRLFHKCAPFSFVLRFGFSYRTLHYLD